MEAGGHAAVTRSGWVKRAVERSETWSESGSQGLAEVTGPTGYDFFLLFFPWSIETNPAIQRTRTPFGTESR